MQPEAQTALDAVAVVRLRDAAAARPDWPSVLTATALPMPAPIEPACPALPVEQAAHKVRAATVLHKGHSKRSRRRAVSKLRAKLKGNEP